MTYFQMQPVEMTNWSRSARSACYVYHASNKEDIACALEIARDQGLPVIPHGAGHSYTDAALNTGGVVLDLTPMRRILSWDPAHGVLRAEPGVSVQEMIQYTWGDGWWPAVLPSTPVVTLGGCAAMNINGRNAWKCGPFGASILSLEVLLVSGETCTLTPEQDSDLFHAVVGSLGLLGIITAVTVQLQRISSGYVTVRRRSASSLESLLALFAEEEGRSDFMEAWLDGFASGGRLGRGILTSASLQAGGGVLSAPFSPARRLKRLEVPLARAGAWLSRTAVHQAMRLANQARYALDRQPGGHTRSLIPFTFWPVALFAGYPAMFPEGVETFQAFVPHPAAPEVFAQLLRYSQQQNCLPLWCVIKQHHRDPFLLSYQVDGYSLELNYTRTQQSAPGLQKALQHMIAEVVDVGGRFYLAKDHFLTPAQYRHSIGDTAVETFLRFKQACDPDLRLQSDLYRRLFMG